MGMYRLAKVGAGERGNHSSFASTSMLSDGLTGHPLEDTPADTFAQQSGFCSTDSIYSMDSQAFYSTDLSVLCSTDSDAFTSGDSDMSSATDSDEEEDNTTAAFTHRADIDGLRAFAVVPVVAYHYGISFPGGFTGVDIFFVISGFLITSIQINKLEQGTFSVAGFWGKRCRRLFPAFAVMLTVSLCVGWFMMFGSVYTALLEQAWATLLMGANVKLYFTSSYFQTTAELPLLHCWSLAVEEQFYVLFPMLLWAVWRVARRAVFPVLATLVVVSLTVAVILTPLHPRFAFYLLPTRAWELALGSVLVFDQGIIHSKAAAEVVSFCGIGMMMTSFFAFDKTTSFPGSAALLPCGGAALFIASQRVVSSSAGKFLGCRYVVFVGKISYSLYLWHWPIYVFLKQQSAELSSGISTAETVVGLCLSVIAAILSFYLVESTTRTSERIAGYNFYPAVAIIWLGLFLFCLVAAILEVGGIRLPSSQQHVTHCLFEPDSSSPTGKCMIERSDIEIDRLYDVHSSSAVYDDIVLTPAWEVERFSYETNGNSPYIVGAGPAGEKPSIAFIGSSHCEMYGPLVERLAVEYGAWVGFMCIDGDHGRFSAPLNDWDLMRLHVLEDWSPHLIVMADFWGGNNAELGGCAQFFHGCTPWLYENYNWGGPSGTLQLLANRAGRVVVLGDVPTLPIYPSPSNHNMLLNFALNSYNHQNHNFDSLFNLHEAPSFKSRRLSVEANIAGSAQMFPTVQFVDVAPYFLNDSTQALQLINPFTGTLAYVDYSHLNADGAEMTEQLFRKVVFNQTIC